MRWWLNTDTTKFAVDNSFVIGVDFSALPANTWMIQWTDGKGEIEYQTPEGDNLNGLREKFFDVTPYVPYFKQFLTLLSDITLDQAQQVQIELINQLFDSKRQLPFHYVVAAGNYWWNATDDQVAAATTGSLQGLITLVNTISAQLNAVIAALNGNDSAICGTGNAVVIDVNNHAIAQSTQLATDFDNALGQIGDGRNAINPKLQSGSSSGYAEPGLSGNIPGTTASFVNLANHFAVTPAAWNNLQPFTPSSTQWIPYGSNDPVPVTPAEQNAILTGIAARSTVLYGTKNTKVNEVKALTTIDEVIAYDVLAGWLTIPLPPTYRFGDY